METSKSQEKDSSWLKPILLALGLAFVIRSFLFSPLTVYGISMEPTLHDHERIIVSKTITWFGEVNIGDIVIIKGEEENYVKRVLGLPGDVIEMKNDELFVNRVKVQEPYLEENKKAAENRGSTLTEDFGPMEIPDNHYFVMGDNRLRSIDSRNELGLIKADRLMGKSKIVIFPFKNIRSTK